MIIRFNNLFRGSLIVFSFVVPIILMVFRNTEFLSSLLGRPLTDEAFISFNLDSKNHHMLFVPEGFAHGYLVLEEKTLVMYKCTSYYNPKREYGIKWDDPDINIDWGIVSPVISDKDSNLPFLKNQSNLPL